MEGWRDGSDRGMDRTEERKDGLDGGLDRMEGLDGGLDRMEGWRDGSDGGWRDGGMARQAHSRPTGKIPHVPAQIPSRRAEQQTVCVFCLFILRWHSK